MEGTLFLLGSVLFGVGSVRKMLTTASGLDKLFRGTTAGAAGGGLLLSTSFLRGRKEPNANELYFATSRTLVSHNDKISIYKIRRSSIDLR